MRIEHPYENLSGGHWLRGNLHTHTTRSDGTRDLQATIHEYASHEHDFLMISDHDIYTSAEDYAKVDASGLVLIPGTELTAAGPHLLHVNPDRLQRPHPQRQRILREASEYQGFLIACHPNWQGSFNHCTLEQLMEWDGYAGMEIYNGVIGRLEGSPYALDKWDLLLSHGRRVWGFANDDSHLASDVARGWNVVYATQRTAGAIAGAMAAGCFYASTGVIISSIHVDDNRIHIKTRNAERIVALQQLARRFAVVDRDSIEVEVPQDATYVRFECWGRGERFAWTQPFFVRRD
ncbi:MAG: PHP domain-containing protein [Bacillota bacterium]